jgi:hypothetical protein
MKKIILLSLFLSFSTCLFSQDIILTKENERIEAVVLIVYEAVVKYAPYRNQDTTILMHLAKIKTITYENGTIENFENFSRNTVETKNVAANQVAPNPIIEKEFKNVVRFRPLVTIVGAARGIFDFEIQYARYITPGLGIPVNVEIAKTEELFGFAIMTGLEGVLIKHRPKSGLFLNALAGIIILKETGLIVNPDIGYQLISNRGFVFNVTLGPEYNSLTSKARARLSLDFGFAF